jgi:hypothetical protein
MINAKVSHVSTPSSQTLNGLPPLPNVQMFAPATKKTFREINFSILNGEEGGKEDRPLIAQFCGNDPQQILTSAKILEPFCDAVDINLGCPQDIAKRGKYGAFLQDEWNLVYDISECRSPHRPESTSHLTFPLLFVNYSQHAAPELIHTCYSKIQSLPHC